MNERTTTEKRALDAAIRQLRLVADGQANLGPIGAKALLEKITSILNEDESKWVDALARVPDHAGEFKCKIQGCNPPKERRVRYSEFTGFATLGIVTHWFDNEQDEPPELDPGELAIDAALEVKYADVEVIEKALQAGYGKPAHSKHG